MSQAVLLIEVVKNALRERGLTYARVANGLGLSESSVKRVFSQENLSLDRLEQICALMDLEIADLLGLSESSVKRVFSQENLSLDRLEQICALMDLEIADLFDLTRAAEKRITELTEEQEQVLVSDPKVLLIAILAINHWTAAVMLEKFRFSESELVA